MNIFVTKLGPNVTQDDLTELFGQYGEVSSAKVIMDRETGNSKGYGFVEMDDDSEGQAAIDALNDMEVDGRRMVVKKARPKEEMGNRRGGGGYDRGNRGGGGYDRGNRGSGGGYDRGNRDGGGYDRDNRGGGGYDRGNRDGGGYDRDNRGGGRRGGGSYDRDRGNRGGGGFGRDNDDTW